MQETLSDIRILPGKAFMHRSVFRAIVLVMILGISLLLNIWNNDFPLGYHADEGKKVRFVAEYTQDFHHPILMLNVVRACNVVYKFKDPAEIVRLGRMTTAVFGTALVLVFFLIARRFLSSPYDLLAALALASSPTLVVHSHYLKEDMIFTCFGYLSLFSFFCFIKKPSWPRTVFLGLSTGLAISSQYKGVLLLPLFFAGILFSELKGKKLPYVFFIWSACIAALVFLSVNYPILTDPFAVYDGMNHELAHIIRGHELHISALEHFFSFHLFNSVIPGMTLFAALPALLAIVYFIFRRASLKLEEILLLVFILIFYFAVELTPMKAHPDYSRYVLPVVPGLIYLMFKGFEKVMNQEKLQLIKIVCALCLILSIIIPLQSSMRFTYYLIRDTRSIAAGHIKAAAYNALFERYSSGLGGGLIVSRNLDELKRSGISHVVVSSFNYDRYNYGATLKNQPPRVYEFSKAYQSLFEYPYVEITPGYKSFAFSNPTIRIINISDNKGQ